MAGKLHLDEGIRERLLTIDSYGLIRLRTELKQWTSRTDFDDALLGVPVAGLLYFQVIMYGSSTIFSPNRIGVAAESLVEDGQVLGTAIYTRSYLF